MNAWPRSRRARLALALAGLALALAWVVNAAYGVRDRYGVRKMTEKMKTVCVGRFLIDLPDNAQVSMAHQFVDGFDLSTYRETAEAFTARVAARQAEIESTPNKLGGKNLEKTIEIARDGLIGKIFIFGRNRTSGFNGREKITYEGLVPNGYVHANGLSFNFTAKDYDPDKIGNLAKLIAQLKGTSKNRRERPQLRSRSGAVRRYGEHRRPQMWSRSRFFEVPSSRWRKTTFRPSRAFASTAASSSIR